MQVHPGPYGTCGDCKRPTPLRLNSLVGKIKLLTWTVDPALMKDVLESLKAHSRMSETHVPKKVPLLDEDGHPVRKDGKTVMKTEKQAVRGMLAYCSRCRRTAPYLFWLEINGGLSKPTCKYCLKDSVRQVEAQDGQITNVPVYSFSCTLLAVHQALRVLEQAQAHAQEESAHEGALF